MKTALASLITIAALAAAALLHSTCDGATTVGGTDVRRSASDPPEERWGRTQLELPTAASPEAAQTIDVGGVLSDLMTNNVEMRVQALERILGLRELDPRLLAVVSELAASDDVGIRVRCAAMHAEMKFSNTRMHTVEMALLAARDPEHACARHLERFDPTGGALLARAAWLAHEGQATSGAPVGVRQTAVAIFQLAQTSPDQAADEVRARLEAADREAASWLLTLALSLRPVPPAATQALEQALLSGDAARQRRAIAHARLAGPALGPAGPGVCDALARALPRLAKSDAMRALKAMGRIGIRTPQVLRVTLEAAKDAGLGHHALATISKLEPRDPSTASALIGIADAVPESLRPRLARTIASIGGSEAVAYIASRIASSKSPLELVAALEVIPGLPSSSGLQAHVLLLTDHRDARVVTAATVAAAMLDPRLENEEAQDAIVRALRADDASRALAGIRAIDALHVFPRAVVSSLLAQLRSDDSRVVREAAQSTARLGERGSAALIAPLLQELHRGNLSGLASGGLVEALANLAPDDARVRSHLGRSLAANSDFALKKGAIRGYAHVENPTREEYLLVVGHSLEGGLIGLCDRVLRKPSWEAARRRFHLKER